MNDLIKGRVWPWEKADLIARLLAEETDLTDCAADRIERTEERNKELTLQLLATSGQASDALDKLAKAMEALRGVDNEYTDIQWGPELQSIKQVRAVLAELEGMK
jgi:hypothetical protein